MKKSLQAVAYHEAGHAVMCIHLDIEFDYVTIVPNEEKFTLGHLKCLPWDQEDWDKMEYDRTFARMKADLECSTLYAGPLAEKKFTGRYNNIGASKDYETVANFLLKVFSNSRVMTAYAKFKSAEVEALFTDEYGNDTIFWQQVINVAEALLERKTLTYQEVFSITCPIDKIDIDKLIASGAIRKVDNTSPAKE